MRHLPKAAVALAAALLLTACTGTDGSDGDGGGPLVVYTNSNTDGRDKWLTEKAAEAGFDIQVVGQGGGDTTNKLLAEVNNPVADVVFGLNHLYFSQLAAANAIEPYTPSWSQEVDPELGDPSGQGRFWPLVQQGIVLAYNADVYGPEEAPRDWTDLWNDKRFHGRYETVDGLGGATTQLVFAGILTRYQDPNGELGISQEGWQQIKGYFEHGSPAVPDVDLYARMAEGKVDMGQMFTSGIPAREKEYGVTTGLVKPEVGVPFAVEQIAVVKGTDQPEQARKFIDWFGSAEVQGAWSAEFGAMPANTKAAAETDPDIVELHQELRQQDIDWDFVGENLASWIEKIELEYVR
ncbi:extracellular solute-binding protein [Thermostaphylospora chromogena]|uniref:Iron(III) transport system substrate-binding protein n=1 Tax=Thermostaphylospora chromogena TaxID=35622 RepID=A0A1H1F5K1_9ACTN|nr:extracellular solute-binding protein [Thermostaphylospora chromogena]SDQ96282.1 iron(III) transport system substrate-binding protein [Thermostaphylospora chromogena]